jgi:hypothetical protein
MHSKMNIYIMMTTIAVLTTSCLEPDEKKSTAKPLDQCTPVKVSAPTWESGIKEIIAANCVACHGATPPDLSTFEAVKKSGEQVLDSVLKDRMPKGVPLAADKKKLLQEWYDAGMPKDASEASDDDVLSLNENDCQSGSGSGSGSGTGSGSATAPADFGTVLEDSAYEALLLADQVAACKDDGVIFNRASSSCSTAKLANYECTREGIIEVFKPTGFQIEEALDLSLGKEDDSAAGEGFAIDQCGIKESGSPIVYLIRKGSKDGEARILLRTLEMD